ncbi:MAG: ATP-grasp domain-containing protein, partial [Desulfobacteraceae bacterium]|nr:ATP-grasp domain-containing protein [Desulfobacteraceae bacterium]
MNIVYLSPHFPSHYHRFCRHLKQAGANVLGIGDPQYDHLAVEVRDSLTDYYRIDDMHNYDALLRACGFFTHKYGKIDRFESLNEYWLSTEARIRDDFNIFGVRGRNIDDIRRKSRMKDKFREAGVPVPRGRVVQTIEDARGLIRETGYPVVAKPDAGVGALDTYRLDSDEDLVKFFAGKPAVEYMMEEFISGTIYSFDGLADPNGNLVFYTAHTFSQGIIETVNEARHIYYYSLREIP